MSTLNLDLQKGLVGHWTLDTEATSNSVSYDSSAYNNHGDVGSNITTSVSSPLGEGYNLSGGQVSNMSGQEIGSTSYAISFWIRGSFKNNGDNYPNIFESFWGRGADGTEAGDSGFRFDSKSTGRYVQAFQYPGKFDSWTHVACSIDQSVGEGYFYQDGSKFYTDTFTAGEYIPDTPPSFFGVNTDMNIDISDFRYYDRFLTAEEINALYNMREQRTANL